ncbi:MAG: VWA domain-containing protein [Planctomycetes bacterium]|nr:VWA domain-containing protein [Planctomycetota bacterium]
MILPFQTGTESESIRFLDAPPAWVVALAIVPGAILLARFTYGWGQVEGRALRLFLAGLRATAFLALAAVLFRPVVEKTRFLVRRAPLVVLLDDSASMQRRDSYPDEEERAGVARAAALAEGDEPGNHSRAELAARAMERRIEGWRQRYDVRLLRFAEDVSAVASPAEVTGRGDRTRIGEAIAAAVEEVRGSQASGIVLVSDGRNTDGRDPREAAALAGADQLPIYAVGVGDARSPKNASIEIVEAPDLALEKDEVAVTVRVRGSGFDGQTTEIFLHRAESADLRPDSLGSILAEAEAPLGGAGGERRMLTFFPEEPGEYRLVAAIPVREGETDESDNRAVRILRVRPEKIRVLYVEGYPRWEYRFLKNLLLRSDRNLQVQCYLLSATPDFPQEHSKGLEPLREETFPRTRRDLLDRYDVVLLGDVPPSGISANLRENEEFHAALKGFVEAGGGFGMIAGEYDSPRSYVGTPIEELLPVSIGSGDEDLLAGRDPTGEFLVRLENPSAPHEICRLLGDADANRRLWEEPGGLRGFRTYVPVRKAKPGAEVLFRHPTRENRYGPHVLAAVSYHPEGRTFFIGTDESWLWRYVYADTYHERFWRNVIRYLALGRLRGVDRRYRIAPEKSRYELSERVVLEARVLDADFAPSSAPSQKAFLVFPDGHKEEAVLDRSAGEAGVYRVSFVAGIPGHYEAYLAEGDDREGKRLAGADFEIVIPSRELADPVLDRDALEAVALASGGRYFPLARVQELDRRFAGGGELRTPLATEVRDLWDSGWVLAGVVALLAVEWLIRKRVQLP